MTFRYDQALTTPLDLQLSRPESPVEWHGRVAKRPLRLGQTKQLTELLRDYAFFTPAVPYIYGRFHAGFWMDFFANIRREVPLYCHRFDEAIFQGLEIDQDTDWNHVLWAIPANELDALDRFVSSVTCMDRPQKKVWRFGVQRLLVLDPLAVQRQRVITTTLPTIPVSAWGFSSNLFWLYFHWDVKNPFTRPKLVRTPPQPEDHQFAQALWAERNPLLAIDPPRPPAIPPSRSR